MAQDNIASLTRSHLAIAAKKRAKHAQIKEVVFDDEARRSFLTGFHKRKVARREQAKKTALLREKQERRETRRQHRRALAERAARNAAEVERACGASIEEREWGGVHGESAVVAEEFEGEEQLATVTVVQDMDVPALLHTPATGEKKHKARHETRAARAEQRKQQARRARRQ